MSLNSLQINEQLDANASATANLSVSCQAILSTYLHPVASPWYRSLNSLLQQAQSLAAQWRNNHASELHIGVLTYVLQCGQAFAAQQENVTHLFSVGDNIPGVKAQLVEVLTGLRNSTHMIISGIANYEARLLDWGERLDSVQRGMNHTVAEIQAEAGNLQARIAAANAAIAAMATELIRDRQVIAEARCKSNNGIVETVFGVLFAPFTGNLSLILTGIGVASMMETQTKVSALESTIKSYQDRIAAAQQMLNRDQAQLVTLNGLLVSGSIALSDVQAASRTLDQLRTSWNAFFEEMSGVVGMIANEQYPSAWEVEKAWFVAACREWDAIVAGAQGILGSTITTKNVTCVYCDVPVVQLVPVASHPPVPEGMKPSAFFSGSNLQHSPNTCVLLWGAHTYWVADYVDDRMAMCILGYDANNGLVKQVSRTGARHMWRMVYDLVNEQIICTGQSDRTVNFGLSELRIEEDQRVA
jgi:hypothetical protein